jgi:hypothetical protein
LRISRKTVPVVVLVATLSIGEHLARMKLLTSLLLAFSLAACGGNKKPATTENHEAATATTADSNAEAMSDDPDCQGGQGTCLALCKGTDEECAKQCEKPICPQIPCSKANAPKQ